MTPWTLIGWAIITLVAGRVAWRFGHAVGAGVLAWQKKAANIRRALATVPRANQRWCWHGHTRKLLDVRADGSVRIDGDSLLPSPVDLSAERWQAEIRAGRLVLA